MLNVSFRITWDYFEPEIRTPIASIHLSDLAGFARTLVRRDISRRPWISRFGADPRGAGVWLEVGGRSPDRGDDVRSREGTDRGDSRRGLRVVSATFSGPPVRSCAVRTSLLFLRFLAFLEENVGKGRSINRRPVCSRQLSARSFSAARPIAYVRAWQRFVAWTAREARIARGAADDGKGPDDGTLRRGQPGCQEDPAGARDRYEPEEPADGERCYTPGHPSRWQFLRQRFRLPSSGRLS